MASGNVKKTLDGSRPQPSTGGKFQRQGQSGKAPTKGTNYTAEGKKTMKAQTTNAGSFGPKGQKQKQSGAAPQKGTGYTAEGKKTNPTNIKAPARRFYSKAR